MTLKPIRVALSGSGFRFAAHVGALAAIEDLGYTVVELSGTSGGSIVGAMYASGKTAEELKTITFQTDFSPMLGFNWSALKDYSYCNGNTMIEFVQSIIGKATTFKDLKIPLHIATSNIKDNSLNIFNQPDQNVSIAVKASAAVPFIYSPVRTNGMYLVDGGICANTPVDLLTDDEILKIGIKLTSDQDTTPIDGAWDILTRTANLLFESADREHVAVGLLEKALFSFVNTGTIGSFNAKATVDERQFMYTHGYNKTRDILLSHEHESCLKTERSISMYTHVNRKVYG